jgi:hypothetical protein
MYKEGVSGPEAPTQVTPLSPEEINDKLLIVPIESEYYIDPNRRPEDPEELLSNIQIIIDEAAKYGLDTNQLAYVLATAHWESGLGGQLAEEGTNKYFTDNYWEKEKIKEALGNLFESDAYVYSGRGFVQLTGRLAYTYYNDYSDLLADEDIDILTNPTALLDNPEVNAKILLDGMVNGVYTGLRYTDENYEITNVWLVPEEDRHKLSDYDFPDQFADAREIIGGYHGEEIAAIAEAYASVLSELCAAGGLPDGISCP